MLIKYVSEYKVQSSAAIASRQMGYELQETAMLTRVVVSFLLLEQIEAIKENIMASKNPQNVTIPESETQS